MLDQLLSIITLAPPLANDLALRPALFDALIDRSALDLPESVPTLRRRMMRAEPQGNYEALLDRIANAGAGFMGYDAAEPFGDYLAGSSHVLPTDGAARAWGGISVYTFLKAISVQQLTSDRADALAAPAATLARLEGLEAHARAADLRGEAA